MDVSRILITGINGFIGKSLASKLEKNGYEVWGISSSISNKDKNFKIDLLDEDSIIKFYENSPEFLFVIHTAALAHGQKPPKGESIFSTNTKMTKNLIEHSNKKIKGIIFLSSVAVYGEENRGDLVSIDDYKKPSTNYGLSKLSCEEFIINSIIKNRIILRLPPVYDDNNLTDVKKRVFLPGLKSVKIILKPSPKHSLISLENTTKIIVDILKRDFKKTKIFNISDGIPHNQEDLANWFKGKKIILPILLTRPIYWITFLLPNKYKYKIRCLYNKFFENNIYKINYDWDSKI